MNFDRLMRKSPPNRITVDERKSEMKRWTVAREERSSGDPRFLAILDEIREMHKKKTADYGLEDDYLANVRSAAQWGVSPWVGVMIRAQDKVIRLQSLREKGHLVNESARDSLLDLASYALIAVVLLDEEEGKLPYGTVRGETADD